MGQALAILKAEKKKQFTRDIAGWEVIPVEDAKNLNNILQIILSAIELDEIEKAKTGVRRMANYISNHTQHLDESLP